MRTIEIIVDGNILEFKGLKTIPNKPPMLIYEYVNSQSKKGETLLVTQGELDNMLDRNICKQVK